MAAWPHPLRGSILTGLLPEISCLPGLARSCVRAIAGAQINTNRGTHGARGGKRGPSQGAVIRTYCMHQPRIDVGEVRHSTISVTVPTIIPWYALGLVDLPALYGKTAWEAPHEH